jgi:ribosome-associated heat shock protein Hsp15
MADLPAIRLDVWLWAARFFKTRALAKQAVETGKVEIGGQRAKPSRLVRPGDALRVTRGDETFRIEVQAVSDTRGPAVVAQGLYQEGEQARQQREAARELRRAAISGYQAPQSKPNKRARRLIRALGDIDAM